MSFAEALPAREMELYVQGLLSEATNLCSFIRDEGGSLEGDDIAIVKNIADLLNSVARNAELELRNGH